MAKCIKCKKEIESLNHYTSGENYYTFSIVDNKEPDYEFKEFQENGQVNEYECPECKETLFIDEEEAIKFLQNE